jgi:hypothetical protein
MRHVTAMLLILGLALPVAAVLTWLLSGFWDWFEMRSGIESVGHSGPAGWCYCAVFAVVAAVGVGTWFVMAARKD